jgi:hypothetical protein
MEYAIAGTGPPLLIQVRLGEAALNPSRAGGRVLSNGEDNAHSAAAIVAGVHQVLDQLDKARPRLPLARLIGLPAAVDAALPLEPALAEGDRDLLPRSTASLKARLCTISPTSFSASIQL